MAQSAPLPIEIDHNGKTYMGIFTTDTADDLITVIYGNKSKTTQLGGASAPVPLARIMLRELVMESNA